MGKKGERLGETRRCCICGAEFYIPPITVRKGHGKYCSRICRGKAERVGKKRCPSCGKELVHTIGCKKGKYCSYKCFGKSIQNSVSLVCLFCGKIFKQSVSHSKREGRGKFCSKKCFDDFQRKGKGLWICERCGKSFHRRRTREYKYCSSGCSCAAQQYRKGLNGLELAGKAILDGMGLKFEEQVLLFGKFTVDVFLRDKGLVVQWDGDYWHGNTRMYDTLSVIQKAKKNSDKACNAYLWKCGLKVLRFWESDVKRRPDVVIARVKEVLCEAILA